MPMRDQTKDGQGWTGRQVEKKSARCFRRAQLQRYARVRACVRACVGAARDAMLCYAMLCYAMLCMHGVSGWMHLCEGAAAALLYLGWVGFTSYARWPWHKGFCFGCAFALLALLLLLLFGQLACNRQPDRQTYPPQCPVLLCHPPCLRYPAYLDNCLATVP